jgi:hypothetical protein
MLTGDVIRKLGFINLTVVAVNGDVNLACSTRVRMVDGRGLPQDDYEKQKCVDQLE